MVNELAQIISWFDLYRMAAGEQTSYTNFSNSLGDTNLDTLATGRGRMDIANGALPNTTEDEDYQANRSYEIEKASKKADTNNVVDGTRKMSTANPILASELVNAMYAYAGESQKEYTDPFEGMSNDAQVATSGHRSTYSDYYKEKEAKEIEMTKDEMYRSECQICGSPLDEHPITEGNDPHEWMPEYPEDYKGDKSPANENVREWWDGLNAFHASDILQDNDLLTGMEDGWDWDELSPEARKKIEQIAPKSAKEGGQGSGKSGHQKWMRGGEFGGNYKECPNCMVYSPHKDSICSICGQVQFK